jgi:hypothetical protein
MKHPALLLIFGLMACKGTSDHPRAFLTLYTYGHTALQFPIAGDPPTDNINIWLPTGESTRGEFNTAFDRGPNEDTFTSIGVELIYKATHERDDYCEPCRRDPIHTTCLLADIHDNEQHLHTIVPCFGAPRILHVCTDGTEGIEGQLCNGELKWSTP